MTAGDVHQSRPRRPWLALTSALAVLLVLAVTFFSAGFTELLPCGGDGGSPYAAPASAAGRYCESPIPAASWVVGALVTVGGCVNATRRRRWGPLAVGTAAGLVVVLSPPLLASVLPERCGDEPESATAQESNRYLREKPNCAHY